MLGASSYTYAEAVWSQSLPDWISAHVSALAFFDGVPRQIVCDNLRSGITRACFYEPLVNRTYADMARHYGTAVIPAQPYKARDKAKVEVGVQKVEVGVQVVQRWIETATRIELLITRVAFPEGTPNGVSLARMARTKKPGVRVLFAARDENREHTEGVGEFLAVPVTGAEIVGTVERMLAQEAG